MIVRRPSPSRSVVEWVEPRRLFSGGTVTPATPTAVARAVARPVAVVAGGPWARPGSAPAAGGATAPFTPAQVRHFYGLDTFAWGATAADGAGQTIAIVDAYRSDTIAADVAAFSAMFGLPACDLTVVNQRGAASPLPPVNNGWAGEITLDVEWAHAIAPGAKILLVECDSAGDDLYAGATLAAATAGVSAVSMSFGGSEVYGRSDATFAGQTGVTFLASTGDTSAAISYPATSPYVVAVGGTSVTTADAAAAYAAESAWRSGGGGVSDYEARPAFQADTATGSPTHRATPDVSLIADPNTGVYTLQAGNYYQVGGTSLSAPAWAGLVAVANQGRRLAGLPNLTGDTQTLPRLYQLPAAAYHDVTTGSNGHPATAGYDLATGLGTPIAAALLPDLAGGAAVTGRVFVDKNANGVYDAADSALANQTVYLDSNGDGTRQTTEPSAVVSSTGTYAIASLPAGGDLLGGLTGTVRLANGTPAGYVAVSAGASVTTAYAKTATANVGLFPVAYADVAANRAYTVRTSASTLQVLVNGTVAYSAPTGLAPSLSFAFTGSKDSLTIDYANGDPVPAGGLSVSGAALAILGTAGADAITANAGSVTFGSDTITFANVPSVTVDPRGGTDSLRVTAGTVTVAAATGVVARTFSALAVASGAKVAVASSAPGSVLVVTTLSVAATGRLDLGSNDLIVRGGSVSTVTALAAGGYAKGAWTGYGLSSSAAAASKVMALGVSQGGSTFDGQSTSAADVVVRYTYYGDADLSGTVTAGDYTRLDVGRFLGLTGWANGDLNYDGVVDAADLALADAAFKAQAV